MVYNFQVGTKVRTFHVPTLKISWICESLHTSLSDAKRYIGSSVNAVGLYIPSVVIHFWAIFQGKSLLKPNFFQCVNSWGDFSLPSWILVQAIRELWFSTNPELRIAIYYPSWTLALCMFEILCSFIETPTHTDINLILLLVEYIHIDIFLSLSYINVAQSTPTHWCSTTGLRLRWSQYLQWEHYSSRPGLAEDCIPSGDIPYVLQYPNYLSCSP